jgi:hypothetical protein
MSVDQIVDLAARCHRLAQACADRQVEARLRELAAEFMAKAEALRSRPVRRREQQPGKPER